MYEYKDPYILDFRNIQYYGDVHKTIKDAFDFPDYYGENWDAFWDCLTDMVDDPIHIHILGLDNFQRKFPAGCKTMLETLEDLRHWHNDRYINNISIKIIS